MKYVLMLALMINTSAAFADTSVRVLDLDAKNKGVECEIKVEKADGKSEVISYTDNNGWVKLDIKCTGPDKVVFIPKGDYYTIKKRCPITEQKIYVSSIPYGKKLLANAKRLFANGDFGASASAFNEVANRVKWHDTKMSLDAEAQTYVAVGKALGVAQSTVIDPNQGKVVISPELRQAIENYQAETDIETSGKLDFNTLRAISTENSWELTKRKGKRALE